MKNPKCVGRYFLVLICLFVLLLSAVEGLCQSVMPSDTPAGKALAAWLVAFNSGDRSKAEAYVTDFDPTQTAEGVVGFHAQTGDLDIVRIITQEPLLIRFETNERRSDVHAIGIMHVDAKTRKVSSFVLRAIPAGAVVDDITVDRQLRHSVVEGVSAGLKRSYIDAGKAQEMSDAIERKEKSGEYDLLVDGSTFATQLTKDLKAVSHDGHLSLGYQPFREAQD